MGDDPMVRGKILVRTGWWLPVLWLVVAMALQSKSEGLGIITSPCASLPCLAHCRASHRALVQVKQRALPACGREGSGVRCGCLG